ncbi:MAG: immunoglobulin domain-containing protein, partial [Verrucomicrobiae bacterium]|nr:immunoglobulin domain-containing protein [Verrucomicrobiae bacterium]
MVKREQSYAANQIILGLYPGSIPEEILALGDLVPLYPESGLGHYLLKLPSSGIDVVEETLRLLASEPYASLTRFAESDWLVSANLLPNDPEVQNGNQWALRNQPSGSDINAEAGWDIRNAAGDVTVAVVDSGININHQDLIGNLWVNAGEIPANDLDDDNNGVVDDIHGYNAIAENGNVIDDNGHGTHVAGIIGAVGNNGLGVTGVAWSTNLMAVKVLNENGQGFVSDITQGIAYAVNSGANIINASFGSYNFQTSIYDILHYAEENNVLVAAAAGNDSSDNDAVPSYPSSYSWENIVAVASLDQSAKLSDFSNFGKNTVDIAGPGGNILSTFFPSSSDYENLSGTSMATPQIAGVLALLVQQFPGEAYDRYIDRLFLGGTTLESLQGKLGYGIVADLGKSLSITEPPSGLRFANRLDNSIVRFPGQSIQLEVGVEDDTDVFFSWSKNGTTLANAFTSELEFANLSTGSAGTYKVVAKKQSFQISDSINLHIAVPNLGLKSAADSNLPLGTFGNLPWSLTSEAAVVGSTAVFSAPLSDNSSSSVFSFIEGPGQLTFHWKVSSEENYDYLQLLVNGEVIRSITGDHEWESVHIRFADSPLRILEWRYIKDGNVAEGLDRGYLDNLHWISESGDFPYIRTQPESLTVLPGEPVTLLVEADGGNLNYQWFKDGLEIPSANQSNLAIANAVEGDSGTYHVEVYNQLGSVVSDSAEVVVGSFPVLFIEQPSDVSTFQGSTVKLSVTVTGSPPIEYQWFKDDAPVQGATEKTLVILEAEPEHSGVYHVRVTNPVSPDGVLSDPVEVSIRIPRVGPTIIKQSGRASVPQGQPATLYVQAVGTRPLSFQWYFNGESLSGKNQSELKLNSIQEEHVGTYYCAVSNLIGETQSAEIPVTLLENLGDLVEQPLLTWNTNNGANVKKASVNTHDGQDAMALFSEPESNITWVSTWIEGPAQVSFWYGMDGDFTALAGRFFLLVDNVVLDELPNPEGFDNYSFTIEEVGLHELRWFHISNRLPLQAYLDELSVTPVSYFLNEASNVVRQSGEPFSVKLDFRTPIPYVIQWYKNGTPLKDQNGVTLYIPSTRVSDTGKYQAKLTNSLGEVWSPVFELIAFSGSLSEALDLPGLDFTFEPDISWIPQSDEVIVGSNALRSPPSESYRSILTKVSGPVNGSFYSKDLEFFANGPYSTTEENFGNGWKKTTFTLTGEQEYTLRW